MAKKRQRLSTADAVEKMPPSLSSGAGTSSLVNLSGQLTSPRRGTRELLELFSQSPWLRAIVGKIARSVAEVDWCLYVKKENGKYTALTSVMERSPEYRERYIKEHNNVIGLEKITSHPLLDVLYRGTGTTRLDGFGVRQVTQEHLDLTGEAFWLLEKDNLGIPKATWPLPPSWVRTLPDEKVPYYEVVVPGGVLKQVPMTEIIPFIDPDPQNPYNRGVSTAMALDDEIQIDEYAAKHQKSFFLNRARPDIIISGQFLSPTDTKRLESQWLADHQGFWKAFKPLFFSQKVDIKELSQSFESMQMVQVRQHERDTFISVFGVPPEKLGVIGDSKRSTIAAADFFWNKDIVKPRLEKLRRPMQMSMVPMFDERLMLEYETPVVQDDEHRLNVMKAAPHSITLNEWREEAGKASLGPVGDVLVVPLNSQLLPVKGENGEPASPEEIVEDNLRAISKADPELLNRIETKDISSGISREISSLLEDHFLDLKKSISKMTAV